ncbi:hypothetical protein [Streptacidiphilus melanogenes]|uniref:hypothetical protein n=1 Tax=Streptacidiphilus melanogenes TaxID=411235 RepID=UPI0005AA5BFE|nr:hypothetical protein [Streptacidiphilus melanogenes]
MTRPEEDGVLAAKDEWAVWQGIAYPCWSRAGLWPRLSLRARDDGRAPSGLEQQRDGAERRYVYLVDPERLDAWYQAHWTFRWRGEPFESCGTTGGGTVRGRYLGTDEEFARLRLRKAVDREAELPPDEVEDVVEHRTDLRALRGERLRLLAETDGYRPRAFAVLGGQEVPAGTEADASGRVAVGGPEARRLVPVGELEAWWGVYWTFTIGDEAMGIGRHPFAALGPDRDTVKGEYIGDQTYGLVMHTYLLTEEHRADGGTFYTGNACPDLITDLAEHRVDLLAD